MSMENLQSKTAEGALADLGDQVLRRAKDLRKAKKGLKDKDKRVRIGAAAMLQRIAEELGVTTEELQQYEDAIAAGNAEPEPAPTLEPEPVPEPAPEPTPDNLPTPVAEEAWWKRTFTRVRAWRWEWAFAIAGAVMVYWAISGVDEAIVNFFQRGDVWNDTIMNFVRGLIRVIATALGFFWAGVLGEFLLGRYQARKKARAEAEAAAEADETETSNAS